MASLRHKQLATRIKNIHKELRKLSFDVGPEAAWEQHLKDEKTLEIYAKSMRELAEKHWRSKATSEEDRIQWTVNTIVNYFDRDEIERWKQKELRGINVLKEKGLEIDVKSDEITEADVKLEVLDVGSSGNFFKGFDRLNILPIDISPSDNSVYRCDFLSVPVEDRLEVDDMKISTLPTSFFNVVIFCLLLEYLPSSVQRIQVCEKAYKVLKKQGILIVITPDSSHEMKNSRQIKNWRWTLSKLGFQRIRLAKLKNLTCMAFRKSLAPELTRNWAENHREPYMEFKLEIPQDRFKFIEAVEGEVSEYDLDLMSELPPQS